jgi:hypothetical protein
MAEHSAPRQQMAFLADGRLHLHDGPIDLIIGADGPERETGAAMDAARRRFATVLDELCGELEVLRQQAHPFRTALTGKVARRMHDAVAPFAAAFFVTPMAAVAGAVADEILATMGEAASLDRAHVNNGGDISLHLSDGQVFDVGLAGRPDRPRLFGHARIASEDGIGGIATSGWRGRSFSLGIADAVTVLASGAAAADAAATLIANAVDLPGHPAIARVPADLLQSESDLGGRAVTRDVGRLSAREIDAALRRGLAVAENFRERRLIAGAALHLQGVTITTGGSSRPARRVILTGETAAHA